MTLQAGELAESLKKFGYRVEISDEQLKIFRKFRIPLFIWAVLVVFLLYLIPYPPKSTNLLVGTAGIFLGLMLYYRNVASQIIIDKKSDVIFYKKGLFRISIYKKFRDVKELGLITYDVPTSASPFKKGTREYIADIRLRWQNGGSVELCNFENRSKEEVNIAQTIFKVIVDFTDFSAVIEKKE